jgi:hypothetical protein
LRRVRRHANPTCGAKKNDAVSVFAQRSRLSLQDEMKS